MKKLFIEVFAGTLVFLIILMLLKWLTPRLAVDEFIMFVSVATATVATGVLLDLIGNDLRAATFDLNVMIAVALMTMKYSRFDTILFVLLVLMGILYIMAEISYIKKFNLSNLTIIRVGQAVMVIIVLFFIILI